MTQEALTLPSNPEAEFFTLSACFNNAETAAFIMDQIQESDFHILETKVIYGIMRECFERHGKVEWFPVMTLCKEKKLGVSIDQQLLSKLTYGFVSGYEYQLEDLKMFSAKRRAVKVLEDAIKDFCNQKTHYDECVERLQDKLVAQYAKKEQDIVSSEDIHNNFHDGKDFETYLKDMVYMRRSGENVLKGIPTNFPKLDETIGGLQNGSLTYVGARSHMGKTTFMLNMMAQIGPKVPMAVITLEMPAKTLYENFVSMIAQQHHYQVSSGMLSDSQLRGVLDSSRVAKEYQIYWEDYGDVTINHLISRIKKLFIMKKIGVVFIDYLTCINGGKNFASKHQEVTEISKRLQGLSKDLNIPIVCLAQLNRDAAKDGKRPTIIDFRESGSIEQDADTCLLLHRPAYYDKNSKPGIMEVDVAKNRLMKQRKTIEFEQIDGKERMRELDFFNVAMEKMKKKNSLESFISPDED